MNVVEMVFAHYV